MHVSDILLECSKECARLSRECRDERVAIKLFEISARLLSVVAHDAELVIDDANAASQSDLHFGFADGE